MVQSMKGCIAGSAPEVDGDPNNDALNKKYVELLDSLLNDKKDVAIKKHPELISAYKALEVYEIYFLAGGDWDEVGAIEFKKKMAKTIVGKLVKGNASAKPETPVDPEDKRNES